MTATATASNSATKLMIMILEIDLRDLNSWSDEQFYYGDIAHKLW